MASNIVEILIGAKDDAKLDLDSLRQRLDDLAHKVAEAKVRVAGDKEAELALDRLGSKLITLGKKTASPKVTLEGAFKTATELTALDLALDKVGKKADGGGTGGGLAASLRNLAFTGSSAMESLGSASISFINPITIALAGLAAVVAGPLLASLAPITLGFVAFGAVATSEITKIITAHQKLQQAQAAYAKATTSSGKSSALAAEKQALAGLSGPEKQVMGLMDQLSAQFHKLEKAVQPQVVKAFGSALKIIKDLMPAIIPLAQAAGKAIDGFLKHIDSWLKSDSGKKFLHWMQTDGPNAIKTFGKVMWDVAQFVGQTFDFLRNAGDTWWKNLHATISHVMHGWDALASFFSAADHRISSDIDRVREAFVSWGHGIESVFDSVKGAVSSAVDFIVGKVHDLTGALSSINGALGGIPGKVLGALGLASGGIAGAASGGIRAGMTLVGEHGPELVQLSAGSRVYNNSQTRDMLSGSSGGNSYSISVQVAPGGHPAETGRQIVNLIREFERGSGKGWRS